MDIQARGTATINTFSSWDSLHTGANQSRGSGHAEIPLLEDRALCLLGPPATQDDVLVEIPDIYLTFLGNLLAQALWWLSEVLVLSHYKHLSESGRLSQNVLHVGCRRPERLRENLLSRPNTVFAGKAAGPSSMSAMTRKTPIKGSNPLQLQLFVACCVV